MPASASFDRVSGRRSLKEAMLVHSGLKPSISRETVRSDPFRRKNIFARMTWKGAVRMPTKTSSLRPSGGTEMEFARFEACQFRTFEEWDARPSICNIGVPAGDVRDCGHCG